MSPIDYHHFGHRFLQHYACFDCRKAFKAGDEFVRIKVQAPGGSRLTLEPRQVACPECGEVMARMGRLFRAPKRSKVKAWAALAARYGGSKRYLGAPFNEPWRRADRLRRAGPQARPGAVRNPRRPAP